MTDKVILTSGCTSQKVAFSYDIADDHYGKLTNDMVSKSKEVTFLEILDYLMLFFSLRANIENNSAMIIFVCSKD